MSFAYPFQKFQDWFSQQWTIMWGRKFDPEKTTWLKAPHGKIGGIGESFIFQLSKDENLRVDRNLPNTGLLPSINSLNLNQDDLTRLSSQVIDFYEKTSNYDIEFHAEWNTLMRPFGLLVKLIFSKRINQLNIPTSNRNNSDFIKSEIIQLKPTPSEAARYTFWLRTSQPSNQVIYSGIYGACLLESGTTCVRAVFPLPKGNATVILYPKVGSNGELILDSSGKKFGDAGFYFTLHDTQKNYWAQYIQSFQDKLTVYEEGNYLKATQTLNLWGIKVLEFKYKLSKRK